MKRSKFILFALLLFALVACSKDDEPKDSSTDPTTPSYDWIRLKSDIYYDSNDLESSRTDYEYDSEGRSIGQTTTYDGVVISQTRDFVYNGYEVTSYKDDYFDGVIPSTNKQKVVYCDDWIRIKEYILYDSNNVDTIRTEKHEYDSEGREIGFTITFKGVLTFQWRDYVYNGKELTFYEDNYNYNSGVLISSYKQKKVYCDDSWIRIKTFVSYYPNDLESDRIEYEYDNVGREIGYTRTTDGVLSFQRRDYVYNGKEVTFYNDNYSDGVLTSSLKQKRIYY